VVVANMINAVKACGTLVRVEPEVFLSILAREEDPLVVHSEGGFFSSTHKYLASHRGLAFHCKSPQALPLPEGVVLVEAKKISIPDM
jgi:hypothetical protein